MSESRPRRRRLPWIAGALGVLLVLCAAGVVIGNRVVVARGQKHLDEQLADDNRQAHLGSWPEAKQMLDRQAAALVAGDEKGWLAAVDPAQPELVGRYRGLYERLHALGVSHWSYHVRFAPPAAYGRADLSTDVTVAWCLASFACPDLDPDKVKPSVPRLEQSIRLRRTGGATGPYVISDLSDKDSVRSPRQPWQDDLVFAQGKRVVVGAPRRMAGVLPAVVRAADQAATVDDRYAEMISNPQRRYRLYVAGDPEWATWFGAGNPKSVLGYATAIGRDTFDVVIHLNAIDPAERVSVIRHEFGHVATLAGTDHTADSFIDVDSWLEEGVAEHIAYTPQHATDSPGRMAAVRAGKAPTSVVRLPPTKESYDREAGRFYGLGYLAVDCFARHYGEAKMVKFVELVLLDHTSYAQAAPAAFGRPFREVDAQCVADIRHEIG